MNLKDKIQYWTETKGPWTHILMAVGITMLIVAIILGTAMPSKGQVNTNKVDIGQVKTTLVTVVDGLATKASQAELDNFAGNVTEELEDQADSISNHGTRLGNAETRINEAKSDIAAIQGNLAELNSPPEAYLTGTFGNYTVHAGCREAGNFTANVHLVYSPSVGNAANYTEVLDGFYAGVNFTEATQAYVPIAAFNGTVWGISQVWWNIGIFRLVANNETAVSVTCAGLNSTWEPDFAYVEIYPALKG